MYLTFTIIITLDQYILITTANAKFRKNPFFRGEGANGWPDGWTYFVEKHAQNVALRYFLKLGEEPRPNVILCRGTDGPAPTPSPFAASPTGDENHCTWRSFHSLALSARNQKLPRANLITAERQSTATMKQKCSCNSEYENDLSGPTHTHR
jgi:hypothetical protein